VFYKHEHLLKELREHGRAATAEILSMRTEGSGNSARKMFAPDEDLSAQWTLAKLDLRVMPEGEPSFDVTVRSRLHTFKYQGETVPVLYDPADHDKVVVDYEADLQAAMAQLAAAREASPGPTQSFTASAAEFRESADQFAKQAASFRASADVLSAIAQAKASGNTAEVERLKAEMRQRLADGPGAA
jgi:hypothetical protein